MFLDGQGFILSLVVLGIIGILYGLCYYMGHFVWIIPGILFLISIALYIKRNDIFEEYKWWLGGSIIVMVIFILIYFNLIKPQMEKINL
jgi:hypothetical protein